MMELVALRWRWGVRSVCSSRDGKVVMKGEGKRKEVACVSLSIVRPGDRNISYAPISLRA